MKKNDHGKKKDSDINIIRRPIPKFNKRGCILPTDVINGPNVTKK